MRRALPLALLLTIGSVLILPGCRRDDRNNVTTDNPDTFLWNGRFYNEDDQFYFNWTTTVEVGRVVFDAEYFDGFIRIRIYDGNNTEIFDEIYIGEGFEERITNYTLATTAGDWVIRVNLEDFTGEFFITVD